jgi:broad specificity phosphatase PhoE
MTMSEPVSQYRPASITLVRHGQSESNLLERHSVHDVPLELRGTPNHKVRLTPLGHEQARATGVALAARFPDGFDHVYVSPYKRTLQTADELLAGFPDAWRARVTQDRKKHDILLREQDFGYADVVGAPAEIARPWRPCARRRGCSSSSMGTARSALS